MNGVLLDVDVSVRTEEAGYQLIVISRNINYASTLAGLAQNFLDDVVMFLRPINSTAERPDIDKIAHNIERLEIILAKKIEQCCGVAATSAQMRVGDENAAVLWSDALGKGSVHGSCGAVRVSELAFIGAHIKPKARCVREDCMTYGNIRAKRASHCFEIPVSL